MQKVEDIELRKGIKVCELVKEFERSGGFNSKGLAEAVSLFRRMVEDDECTVFLSFPACIVATGTRGVLREMIKREMVDVIITTCGALDHDLARLWGDYYHGSFFMDDAELHRKGINRIGNVLAPNECYEIVERKMDGILEDIYSLKKRISTRELVWEIGRRLEGEDRHEESIVYWCYRNGIPMFIPGITDGAIGCELWTFHQTHRDFFIDSLADEDELSDIIFSAKKTGALVIGGGISKHHTIWWNQFRDGLNYAIYMTTAIEWDGSLSGARVQEAVSWGKVREDAEYVMVYGDATISLPILVACMME